MPPGPNKSTGCQLHNPSSQGCLLSSGFVSVVTQASQGKHRPGWGPGWASGILGLALEGEYVKGHLTYCDLQEAPSKLQVPSLEPGKQVEDGQNREPLESKHGHGVGGTDILGGHPGMDTGCPEMQHWPTSCPGGSHPCQTVNAQRACTGPEDSVPDT